MWRFPILILATVWTGCSGTGSKVDLPSELLDPSVVAADALEERAAKATVQLSTYEAEDRSGAPAEGLIESMGSHLRASQTPDAETEESGRVVTVADSEDAAADALELSLEGVIGSVYQSYPLLLAVQFERGIATGDQLSAAGEFDLKVVGGVESTPAGFYETYRSSIGLVQPLYTGGKAYAGYRVGRGSFEPWYRERQTNSGGELKAGVAIPLSRDRHIDERRLALWKATYGRKLAEPEIQAQLIAFVQEASYAYWSWVAAGQKLQIAERILRLAEDRTARMQRQVEQGLLDPPELTDNLRLVADRRSKYADAARKVQQAAVKLSLFYRDADGNPLIPPPQALPGFPVPQEVDPEVLSFDSQRALQQRPEIETIRLLQRQLDVDYAQAHNEFRPAIDAVVGASQDLGVPTSKRDDKSQFQMDAAVLVDVPLQRRKARGKMQSIDAKRSQLNAKRRMVEDKIVAEVQGVYLGMSAAIEQARQAEQAVQYAEDVARRERRNFELGASDLLKVTLREQYAAESAEKAVDALLLYHESRADYRAALAEDRL